MDLQCDERRSLRKKCLDLQAGLQEALEQQRSAHEKLFAEFMQQLQGLGQTPPESSPRTGTPSEGTISVDVDRSVCAEPMDRASTCETFESFSVSAPGPPVKKPLDQPESATPGLRRNLSILDYTAWMFKESEAELMDASPTRSTSGWSPKLQHVSSSRIYQWQEWWRSLDEPKREGRLSQFIYSFFFQTLCILVILLNGFVIIYSTDLSLNISLGKEAASSEQTIRIFLIIEYCFLAFYSAELILKLACHGWYFFVNEDAAWNLLDFLLVLVSVVDLVATSIVFGGGNLNMTFLRSFRLLKVSKVLRTFRALQFISELRVMMACLFGCFLQLFWALFLLVFLLCLFSIFFTQGITSFLEDSSVVLTEEELEKIVHSFGSVAVGMVSLFQSTSGGRDWSEYYNILMPIGPLYSIAFLFYILFFMISVMNIVTSIFIDRAMKLAKPQDESIISEKERDDLRETRDLLKICEDLNIDQDGDGLITHDDLKRCMADEKVREYFAVRGITFEDTTMFYRMLAKANGRAHPSSKGVDIFTFVMICMRLRGGASNLDLHTLAFEVKLMHRAQGELSDRFAELLNTVLHGRPGSLGSGHSDTQSMEARLQCFEEKVLRSVGDLDHRLLQLQEVCSNDLKPKAEEPCGGTSPSSRKYLQAALAAIDDAILPKGAFDSLTL